MTNFLSRLVERTRGTLARVEPIVAPRFSHAKALLEETALDREVPTPADQRARGSPITTAPATMPAVDGGNQAKLSRADEQMSAQLVGTQRESLLVPLKASGAQTELTVRRIGSEIGTQPVPAEVSGQDRFSQTRSQGSLEIPGATLRPRPRRSARLPNHVAPELKAPESLPNESTNEPPIVRVSIGRIEVRTSSPPPAQAKAPSRNGPRLTLDAYLEEKKGARR